MSTIEQAESSVSQLSAAELRQFRAWFEAFDAELWDQQFTDDATSGRLDGLADQAIRDFKAGRCTEL
jgi:hypothetical protein